MRQHLYAIARINYSPYVRPSVCLSDIRVDQSTTLKLGSRNFHITVASSL